MNTTDTKALPIKEQDSAAVALPDQSLAQMCAFVALMDSLDLIENTDISETALATLPEATRRTLLDELHKGMSELHSQRRAYSSVRATLARLKHDARQALDVESIAQYARPNHQATDQKS